MIQKGHLGRSETVIIHTDTNDLRSTGNLDFWGENYLLWWLHQRGNSELQTCPEWSVAK